MIHYGLLVISVVQLGTAVAMLLSVRKNQIWGIATLPPEFSIYRFMLTALWMAIGLFYLVGAFYTKMYQGASLLAVINSVFEVIGYLRSNLPKWYKMFAVPLMLILGIWCGLYLII